MPGGPIPICARVCVCVQPFGIFCVMCCKDLSYVQHCYVALSLGMDNVSTSTTRNRCILCNVSVHLPLPVCLWSFFVSFYVSVASATSYPLVGLCSHN